MVAFFNRNKKDDDAAGLGRDDRAILGIRLDHGKYQDLAVRFDEPSDIIAPSQSEQETREILEQLAIVEELEREFSKLPESVQKTVGPELTAARNALSKGQKVSPATISHLTQARNDQEMRNMLETVGGGALALSGGCAICGGEEVSRGALFTGNIRHGVTGLLGGGLLGAISGGTPTRPL